MKPVLLSLCLGLLTSPLYGQTTTPVTLEWIRNPASDNVTTYRLYLNADPPVSMGNPADDPACLCPTYMLNLAPGIYTLHITAVNPVGESGPSNTVATTIGPPPQPASSPTGLRLRLATPPPPPTAQTVAVDVGTTQPPGSSTANNGVYTLTSAGLDTWGSSDSFHFLYTDKTGDGAMIAHVTGLTNTHGNAKAGIMWRESTAANAREVQINVGPSGAIEFMFRATTDGNVQFVAGSPALPLPRWLRLARVGTAITGYVSTNGTDWVMVGTTQTAMPSSAKLGLFALSHQAGVSTQATFDGVIAQ